MLEFRLKELFQEKGFTFFEVWAITKIDSEILTAYYENTIDFLQKGDAEKLCKVLNCKYSELFKTIK